MNIVEATYVFSRQVALPVHLIVLPQIEGTINIINHYTNLPASIMNDAAGIIDKPENGMLLDLVMHRQFDSFAWCLHSDIMHKYTVHWFDHKAGWDHFTQVRFQDHSQNAIALPDPSLIALHSAVAHVRHLSGAAKVIDKVYDAFSDEGHTVPSGNRASKEDFRIGLSLIGLTTNKHQLPTNPQEIHPFR